MQVPQAHAKPTAHTYIPTLVILLFLVSSLSRVDGEGRSRWRFLVQQDNLGDIKAKGRRAKSALRLFCMHFLDPGETALGRRRNPGQFWRRRLMCVRCKKLFVDSFAFIFGHHGVESRRLRNGMPKGERIRTTRSVMGWGQAPRY
jgi:hypothetical protein